MKKGDIVKLGPWNGVIVDLMTNEDGECFARVKLVKHKPNITEVHPANLIKPSTMEAVTKEYSLQVSLLRRNFEMVKDAIAKHV